MLYGLSRDGSKNNQALAIWRLLFKKFAGEIYSSILVNTTWSSLFAIAFTLGSWFVLMVPTYVINRWFSFVVGRKKVTKR